MDTGEKQTYMVRCNLMIGRNLEVRAPNTDHAERGARRHLTEIQPAVADPWTIMGGTYEAQEHMSAGTRFTVACQIMVCRDVEILAADRATAELAAKQYTVERKPPVGDPWLILSSTFAAAAPEPDEGDEDEDDEVDGEDDEDDEDRDD